MSNNTKLKRTCFDNLTQLLNKSVNGDVNELIKSNDRRSRDIDYHKFFGTRTFEDAISIATNWPEGRDIIENYTREYSKMWTKFFPGQDFTSTLKSEIGGSIPIVENYIIGVPEDMLEFHPNEELENTIGGCKLQRIILNSGVSHYIDIKTILKYGALIGALINSMELSGFSVELNVVWNLGSLPFVGKNEPNPRGGLKLQYDLKIKGFSDILDLEKLAFCLAHSSMLRRFIFSLAEQEPDEYIKSYITEEGGYGYPINLTEDEITKYGLLPGEVQKHGNLYFRLLDANYSLEQLVDQCVAVVKEHFTEVSFNDPNLPPPIISPNDIIGNN